MHLLDTSASGVFAIAVTPFTENGDVDLDGVGRLFDFYLGHGVSGLTVLGIMGEAAKLSAGEQRAFVGAVCRHVDGRVPVVVGVSAPGFMAMRELAASAMDLGAAGVMVAAPHSVRTDDQIIDYFLGAADGLGPIPFVLQDFPLASGVQISASVLRTLIAMLPTCVMIKHEDWPGLNKVSALRTAERRVSILAGNGGLFLPEELGRGVDGAMTGFAFPEMLVSVCRLHGSGEVEAAFDRFDAYLPLVRYEQQMGVGLAVRKHVLARRGAIRSARLRKPGSALSGPDQAEVEHLLVRQERRLAALA